MLVRPDHEAAHKSFFHNPMFVNSGLPNKGLRKEILLVNIIFSSMRLLAFLTIRGNPQITKYAWEKQNNHFRAKHCNCN